MSYPNRPFFYVQKSLVKYKHLFEGRSGVTCILILIILCMCFIAGCVSPLFLIDRNLSNILIHITILGVVVLGQTFVLIGGGGGIDLSVGAILTCSASIGTSFILNGTCSIFTGSLISLLVGALLGFCNGLIITLAKVPPMVTTLSMAAIIRGSLLLFTNGRVTVGGIPQSYAPGIDGAWGSVGLSVLIVAGLFVVAHVFTRYTTYGHCLYAVGGNEFSAYVAGVNIARFRILTYICCGICSAVAGILISGRVYSIAARAVDSLEMTSIAAAVIGGVRLSGGKGKILGTLLGVLVLVIIDNIANLLVIPTYYLQIFKGAIILFAAATDHLWAASDNA